MKAATMAATTAKMKVAVDCNGSDNCSGGGREKDYCSELATAIAAFKSGRKLRFARLCYMFRKCEDWPCH